MTLYDNIIIGAGPGGYELAATLASRGESVLIIERGHLGGTCLNRGCIPTKCLVATAKTALSAREASNFGVETGEVKVDFSKAAERMNAVVAALREGVKSELAKCTVLQGEARMMPDGKVQVGDEIFGAEKRTVIATGSRPALLPIEGASLAVTSDEVLSMDILPQSVVIIGGGVIGMEFASILSAFGVKTTVIEFCKEILPPFDPEVAKRLRTTMSRRGIDIVTGAAVNKIEHVDNGILKVTYAGKRGDNTIEAEKVIMAVGRRPVLPEGISEAGIELTEKGYIKVDKNMETSVKGVYAIGDVNGLMMLAHAAIAQGRVVAEGDGRLFNPYRVPSIVFTHPEVSMVGMTPAQLEEKGIKCSTTKHLYAGNGKAQAMGKPEGFIKFVTLTENNDRVAGVSIIGAHAADLIAEATMLVTDCVSLNDINKRYIHAHPTLSELF